MEETIRVPVTLMSLAAAIEARVNALTLDSPPDDVLAIIGLLETLEGTLDRLALAVAPLAINTVADVAA
jgi:hypothetical protein